MVDPELIKYTYANLPDTKLIVLVKEDGPYLTYEAFILLKREYISRKLDPGLISEVEKIRQEQSKEKIRNNFIREEYVVNHILWKGVLTRKAEGKKDKEIIDWLITEAIPAERAVEVIGKLAIIVKGEFNKARKRMLLNFSSILGGSLLLYMAILGAMTTTCLITGGMLIAAAVKYLPANNRTYRLCEKALIVIEEEYAVKGESQ